MERHGDEVHITTEEARGGRTPQIMRFVLAISVLLAIVALALVWVATSSSKPDINQATASEPTPAASQ
jgi:hypothetical protein